MVYTLQNFWKHQEYWIQVQKIKATIYTENVQIFCVQIEGWNLHIVIKWNNPFRRFYCEARIRWRTSYWMPFDLVSILCNFSWSFWYPSRAKSRNKCRQDQPLTCIFSSWTVWNGGIKSFLSLAITRNIVFDTIKTFCSSSSSLLRALSDECMGGSCLRKQPIAFALLSQLTPRTCDRHGWSSASLLFDHFHVFSHLDMKNTCGE